MVGSSADKNSSYIPKGYSIPEGAEYFHYTSNNTIYGTQTYQTPQVNVPLVCDMSSDFMSHPFDVSKYDIIYAGAQKNLGPLHMCRSKDNDDHIFQHIYCKWHNAL